MRSAATVAHAHRSRSPTRGICARETPALPFFFACSSGAHASSALRLLSVLGYAFVKKKNNLKLRVGGSAHVHRDLHAPPGS